MVSGIKRRKRIKLPELDEAAWTPKAFFWLFVIVALTGVFMFAVYRIQSADNGPYRPQYEGRVIDKWANYSETQQGSFPYYRLMIEGNDGIKFSVSVSYDIYERAKVGMKIKKTDSGIELFDGSFRPPAVQRRQ